MKNPRDKDRQPPDRVVGTKIILNGQGKFPKRLVILETEGTREYKIVKTQYGRYQLNR